MQSLKTKASWALLVVLCLPLISMVIVPFQDTSEPRYAEIARLMMHTGDWITPWFSPGVPFWGKPPLSFWSQALSMNLFGVSEFAARLPAWIYLLLSNAVLLAGLNALKGPRVAVLTAIIYSTCTLVYMSFGAVLTDPFLAFGTTLSLVSFAVAVGQGRLPTTGSQDGSTSPDGKKAHPAWRYGFFIGLAIGLLAKGPLAAVLVLAPVAIWTLLNWKASPLRALPWGKGIILVAALSLPWYILAEIKTPGFINYFIIGEHLLRFLDPGWAGDMYGSAHERAYGTIWVYWLMASFPWGIVAIAVALGAFFSTRIRSALASVARDPFFSYWLTAALFTLFFFTFSANILWTYVLPSLAGFSVLAAMFADRLEPHFRSTKYVLMSVASVVPVCVLIFSVIVGVKPELRTSERGLIQHATQADATLPVLYLSSLPFSARFYSGGQAQRITADDLPTAARCAAPFFLAVPKGQQEHAAGLLQQPSLQVLYTNKRFVLTKVEPQGACENAENPGVVATF